MMGYLYGALIAGLIVATFAIECYKTKDQLKNKLDKDREHMKNRIEEDKRAFDMAVKSIDGEIARLKTKMIK